jgi:hypothetical protein
MESTPDMESTYKLPQSIRFFPDKANLLLDVALNDISIPESIRDFAEENNLREKEELHITVFGFREGKRIIETMDKSKDAALMDLIENADWSYREKSEFYMLNKEFQFKTGGEKRESIIVKLDMPYIDDFVEEASSILDIQLNKLMPHITLYTKSTNMDNMLAGIGIDSEDDFLSLNPERIEL